MSNMIEVNKKAFILLIEQFHQRNDLDVEDAKRYFSTNYEEKEWIKTAKITDKVFVTPNLRVIQVLYKSKIYFAAIGANLDTNSIDNTVIVEIEANAGIISLLVSEGLLRLDNKSDYLDFYNSILFQHQDIGYIGHSYKDLLQFLEEIYIFEVPEFSVVKSDWISRIACYIYSNNSTQLILDFNQNVTVLISELSLVGSDSINYKIMLSCLFSNSYKHAFLELYRLVERLFSISYLKEFHSVTKTRMKFLDFVTQLENITNWRPRENEAIEKIFSSSKQATRNYFQNFQATFNSQPSQNDFTLFYNLRNSIVHFRANHLEHELNTNQWNLLLYATLFLIDEHYSVNDDILK